MPLQQLCPHRPSKEHQVYFSLIQDRYASLVTLNREIWVHPYQWSYNTNVCLQLTSGNHKLPDVY